MKIGVISDTHGLLRPEAVAALRGADRIIHAGDIGAPEVLTGLAAIAPVVAVRGNNDKGRWAASIPDRAIVEAEGMLLYVLHDLHTLDVEPQPAGFRAVIAGHSHKPSHQERDGVLYFNPGSAGPRRFKLPVSIGWLMIERHRLRAESIDLKIVDGVARIR